MVGMPMDMFLHYVSKWVTKGKYIVLTAYVIVFVVFVSAGSQLKFADKPYAPFHPSAPF